MVHNGENGKQSGHVQIIIAAIIKNVQQQWRREKTGYMHPEHG